MAQVMRKELTPTEILLWEEALAGCLIDGVRAAFMRHMQVSKFFPVPAEIIGLYADWLAERHAKEVDVRKQAEHEETERRRAGGETFGLADVLKQFNELLTTRSIPDVDPKRRGKLKAQAARMAAKPLQPKRRARNEKAHAAHVRRTREWAAKIKQDAEERRAT
jgi:hypothetical protein